MDEQLNTSEELQNVEGAKATPVILEKEGNSVDMNGLVVPPQNKKSKTPIIVIAVIAVLVIGGIFAFSLLGGGHKGTLAKAIAATFAETSECKGGILELSGANGVLKELAKVSSHTAGELSISSVSPSMGEEAYLKGIGLGYDALTDAKSKKMFMTLSAKYKGTDVLQGEMYTDDETMLLGVPALLDGYISLKTQYTAEELKNSVFGRQLEASDKGLDLRLFGADTTDMFSNPVLKAFIKKTEQVQKNLISNIEVTKLKDKVDVAGVSCDDYEVTVKADDIKAYANAVGDYLKNDEDFVAYLEQSYTYAGGSTSVEEFNESVDILLDEINESIAEDFMVQIAVDDKGRAVQFKTTLPSETPVGISISFIGKKAVLDKIEAGVSASGIEVMTMKKETKFDADKNEYQNDMSLVAAGAFDGTVNTKYNNSNGEMQMNAQISSQGEEVAFDVAGTLLVDKANSTINADFSEIMLTVDTSNQQDFIGFVASYEANKSEDAITAPEGEKLEIMNMSASEIDTLTQQMSNKLLSLLFSIMYL